MISIIIPAFNEERYIGRLLDSIAKQSYNDYEVIVVDGRSTDSTKKVVESYSKHIKKLKFIVQPVSDKKKTQPIGAARNLGVKCAKGDYLLFLDADVILTKSFLGKFIEEFDEKFLDVATCYITPLSTKYIDKVLHDMANVVLFTSQYVSPRAPGFCILTTKRMHNRVEGFSESMKMGEDHDYVQRAGDIGKFRVVKGSKIPVSVRRLDEEGRARAIKKYFISEIYRTFNGEKADIKFEYVLGNHK